MPKRFSASVAAMSMACHASANLDLAIPGWVEPVRDEMAGAKGVGTLMHEAFAKVVEQPASDIKHMISALQYVADLRSKRRFKVLVEHEMKATWLTSEPKTTADLVLYTQDEMHVLDLKWGKIEVDVYDNEQLMFGAVTYGALAPKAKGVTTHILQPRAGGFASEFVDTLRLQKFMKDAQDAERAILNGSIQFGPSEHCTFCPANPHSRGDKGSPLCPVMMQMLYPRVIDEDEILAL
jgi:hypothetical protein